MRRLTRLVLVFFIIVAISSMCYAQGPARKLGRGVANIVTGWVEIPKTIYVTCADKDVLTGLTIGPVQGIWMFLVRTSAGVYEFGTFPVPIPEDYDPILRPEFVLSSDE